MYAEWHDRTRLKFVIQSRRAGEVGSITSSYVLFPECVFLERARGGNVFFIKDGNYVVAEERQEIRVAEKRRFSVSFHAQVDSLYRNPPPYGSSFNSVHECARWECRRPRNTDLRRVLIHFFEISVPFFAERYEKLLEMARIPDVSNCYDASDNFNMHRGIFQIVGNIFHWFLVYFFWSIFLFCFKALYTIRR